jgi:chromate reductase
MPAPTLLLVPGALRAGSFNRMLLNEAARLFNGEAIMADTDLPLYNGDVETNEGIPAKVQTLADQIAAADAVLLGAPEYNQSMSGVLKNALDWVSRTSPNPWLDKPVGIVSSAAGRAGGARGQYALRLAMNPFQARVLAGPEVMVAAAETVFDADGRLTDERYMRALKGLVEKLTASIAVKG